METGSGTRSAGSTDTGSAEAGAANSGWGTAGAGVAASSAFATGSGEAGSAGGEAGTAWEGGSTTGEGVFSTAEVGTKRLFLGRLRIPSGSTESLGTVESPGAAGVTEVGESGGVFGVRLAGLSTPSGVVGEIGSTGASCTSSNVMLRRLGAPDAGAGEACAGSVDPFAFSEGDGAVSMARSAM